MNKISELKQKKVALLAEARAILDKAEKEERSTTSEENQEYDRLSAEMDSLEATIRIETDLAERQRSIAQAQDVENTSQTDEQEEYRSALNAYFRKGERGLTEQEKRALVVGTDSAGGYLVPTSFRATLLEALEEPSAIRANATVLTTSGGGEILIPKVTSYGAAQWVAEGSDKPIVDDVFDQVSLKAHKAAVIVKVSTELLEDAGFNLENYLAVELGRKIGRLEGAAYATGAANSTTTPKGIVNVATEGVVTASASAPTADELISLVYSVSRPYRQNARFLMNDAMVAIVRKLKANNEYIWAETANTINGGEPARLLGYPVEIEPNMDGTPADGDFVMVFGDLKGYFIRDVDGIRIQRLNELYAVSNHVGFLAEHRTDGDLIDTNAVRVMRAGAGASASKSPSASASPSA